jgi:hypothetical protein
MFSPVMARDRLVYPFLRNNAVRVLGRVLVRPAHFTGQYADGWIGPVFRRDIEIPPAATRLTATLVFHPQPGHQQVTIELWCDGKRRDQGTVTADSFTTLQAAVDDKRGKRVSVEIRSSSFFCPKLVLGGEDGRELSVILSSLAVEAEA